MANNFYATSDYAHTEIIRALEDFKYDNYVRCSILSISQFMNQSSPVEYGETIYTSVLENKGVNNRAVGVGFCNYLRIFIPKLYYIPTYPDEPYLQGYQGDEFVGAFMGGSINTCTIVGRYYK